ncbi:MAG: T9SS type A sorting domain-containing protein [Bacteroidia bacterium]|nr:T9SS type A sorting domain-containing protein [Bacteroidia bacterium]
MKKILLLSLIFTFGKNVNAQLPSQQWVKNVNGNVSSSDQTYTSCRDNVGNLYLAAYNNDADVLIAKFDNQGNQVFSFTYGGANNSSDIAYDIKVDNVGNIYFCGGSFTTPTNSLFLAKFNSAGVKQWVYTKSSLSTNYNNRFQLDNISNPANIYTVGNFNDSIYVSKISSNGVVLWEKSVGPGYGTDLFTDANGNTAICGIYQNGLNNDWITQKYSASGALAWSNIFNGAKNQSDVPKKIMISTSGETYTYGTMNDSIATFNSQIGIIKYSSSGLQLWKTRHAFTGCSASSATDMVADATFSNFYVCAYGSFSPYGGTVMMKVSSAGAKLWTQTYTNASNGFSPVSMGIDAASNTYVTGNNNSTVVPVGNNIFLIKVAPSNGAITSYPVFDNQNNGGGADDYAVKIHMDNTGHPHISGYTNVFNYTGNDLLLLRFTNSFTLDWQSTYDSQYNGGDLGKRGFIDPAGNFYVGGTVDNNNTQRDLSFSKYDTWGNLKWSNPFDFGNTYNDFYDMDVDNNFSIYSIGVNSATGQKDIIKVDSSGNLSWTSLTAGLALKAVPSGGAVVGGSVSGSTDFKFQKYGATGAIVAQNTPATVVNSSSYAQSVAIDAGNNSYISGIIQNITTVTLKIQKYNSSGTNLFNITVPGIGNGYISVTKTIFDNASNLLYVVAQAKTATGANYGTFICAVNPSGTIVWQNFYNNSEAREEFTKDFILSGGFAYVTGYFADPLNTSDQMVYIEKYDMATGALSGNTVYNGPQVNGTDEPISVRANAAGEIYLGLTSNYSSATSSDIVIAKFNSSLSFLWDLNYDDPDAASDQVGSLEISANGRIYIAGSADLSSGPATDIAAIKYCEINAPVLTTTDLNGSFTSSFCPGSPAQISASAGSSYLWNTGATSQVITSTVSGQFFATVAQSDGCSKVSDTINLSFKAPPLAPDICMVTVDSLSTHNIIFYDKTSFVGNGTIGFKFYREDLTNVYTYIGSQPIDSLSEYHDFGANPNITTKRYKMSAVDSCGTESAMSNYHNTIYIISVGSGQFTWNPLYTIENTANPVNNYELYRDDNSTGVWASVANTAGTQNSLVDINYAAYPNASYYVSTVWGISCDPQRAIVNTSRSNVKNMAAGPTLGITELAQATVGVYPNPFTGIVQLNSSENLKLVEVYNSIGQLVFSKKINGDRVLNLDLSELAAGVYQLRSLTESGWANKKLVKN